MPSVSFRVDQKRFNNAAADYLRQVPMEMGEAITMRMRRLLMRLRRHLPPKSSKQGKTRIGIDLTKAALPMNPANMRSDEVREVLQQRNLPGLQSILDRSSHPKMIGRTATLFTPRVHQQARNRKGRVENNQQLVVPNYKDWKRHNKDTVKHVGSLKGSILYALRRVGGKVPTWLARHGGLASIHDDRRNKKTPTFMVTSRLPWSGAYMWAVKLAYRSEEKVMVGDLKRRLKHAAKKSGF